MENLYKQFENLLTAFLKEFLEKLNSSAELEQTSELSDAYSADYWKYLEEFARLQKNIENCAPTTTEDLLKRSQALTILRNSSQAIFRTFSSSQ